MPSAKRKAEEAIAKMTEWEKDHMARQVLELVRNIGRRTGHLTEDRRNDRITP